MLKYLTIKKGDKLFLIIFSTLLGMTTLNAQSGGCSTNEVEVTNTTSGTYYAAESIQCIRNGNPSITCTNNILGAPNGNQSENFVQVNDVAEFRMEGSSDAGATVTLYFSTFDANLTLNIATSQDGISYSTVADITNADLYGNGYYVFTAPADFEYIKITHLGIVNAPFKIDAIQSDYTNTTITCELDTDGDLVADINDLDDDNDGILDTDECSVTITFTPLSITGIYSYMQDIDGNEGEHFGSQNTGLQDDPMLIFDGDLNTELRMHADDVFELGLGQIIPAGTQLTLREGSGNNDTTLSVYVSDGSTDTAGDANSGTGGGVGYSNILAGQATLVGANLDSDLDYSFTVPHDVTHIQFVCHGSHGGWGELVIDPPTQTVFSPTAANCDTDGDGTPDSLDIDSDGDGCSDADEAYYGTIADADPDNDGVYGAGAATVDSNGLVTGASYASPNSYYLVSGINTCIDTDNDGVADIGDLDDDNDGILDTDECEITDSGHNGSYSSASFTYGITSADPNNLTESHVLDDITLLGTTYSYFILPDSYSSNFSGITATSRLYLTDHSVASNDYFTDPSFSTNILPAFQSRDLNYYQTLNNKNFTADSFTLTYNSPITVTGEVFIALTERNGNNPYFVEALDALGNVLGSITVNIADYVDTGHRLHSSTTGMAYLALFPIDDIAPLGAKISALRMTFPTATTDGPDGKVFFFGDFSAANCDTDSDGIPNHLDTDSDNDGCSDANEAYGDANADGGDNEYYGTGNPPAINPDGTVVAASYATPADVDSNSIFDFQEVGVAPSITSQPSNSIVFTGMGTTFSVEADDTDTYQWQISTDGGATYNDLSDDVIYTDTDTPTLTIGQVNLNMNNYRYRAIVSSSLYVCSLPIQSNAALLTVRITTVITNRRITHRVNKN